MANITESLKSLQLTKEEVEKFGDALKNKEFRKMLIDYVEEVQSPENQRIYEQEIIELEKQRGVDVTFLKPNAGYVLKTSADGEKKVFVNICSNDLIKKPTSNPSVEDGSRGYQWQVPHSLTPPRDDVDKQGKLCKVYDFVCHPSTLELAQKTKTFKDMLNNMACETIESNFNVKLDRKNLKFPKMQYKGRPYSAVMRKPSNSSSVNPEDREFMDKLFSDGGCPYKPPSAETKPKTINIPNNNLQNQSKYTIPKYNIKHRSHIELEQFIEHKTAKMNSAIPKELVVEIILPLLKSASDVVLDVNEKSLQLISEKPAKYKLDLNLPYEVVESLGNAKFEKDKKKLIVTLPVKRNSGVTFTEICREDSGIESDHASFVSSSPAEENERLVTEMNDGTQISDSEQTNNDLNKEEMSLENVFLDPSISYLLPDFTVHLFDDTFAFTLNVKNVTDSSLIKTFQNDLKAVHLKFTSVSSGFFPLHYAFYFRPIDAVIDFETIVTEVWDNNVEVQIPVKHCDKFIESFLVGTDSNNLTEHYLDNNVCSTSKFAGQEKKDSDDYDAPTNPKPSLLVSTDQSEDESSGELRKERKKSKSKGKQSNWKNQRKQRMTDGDVSDNMPSKAIDIAGFCESSGDELSYSYSPYNKGILKNLVRRSFSRSMSESSIDEVMLTSSVENCHSIDSAIPEEHQQVSTSLKKTVRFNDVVSKQVFRSNSSILGQRRKNQRKAKAKKRAHEKKHSESELSENEEKKDQIGSNENESSSEGTGLSENESNSSDKRDKNGEDSNAFSNDIFLMDIDF
ncbi:protein kintoun [Agrilus planipennis]|uniref:Protein kintoun n=1 Tax=Agrilus planipennis TaxID=224129 RepID=A0A1W4WJF7_AGRPL|nr:protein kintoun [Agrilus planipennis]